MSKYVTVTASDESIEYWALKPFVPDEIRASVRGAQILIVPQEGFRDVEHPMFPVGTEELVAFFRENLPADVGLELPIGDEDYEELALHGAMIIVGTFVITALAAPIFVGLVTEAVKNRFPQYFGGTKRAEAQVEIHVQKPDGSFAKVRYEGPADLLLPTLSPVVRDLAAGNPPQFEESNDRDPDSDPS